MLNRLLALAVVSSAITILVAGTAAMLLCQPN
jgi:hypothetical protein